MAGEKLVFSSGKELKIDAVKPFVPLYIPNNNFTTITRRRYHSYAAPNISDAGALAPISS